MLAVLTRPKGEATPGSSSLAGADLDAFRRHGSETAASCSSALVDALNRLRATDDPVVAFARLAEACVPEFADGCGIEIAGGAEQPFRATFPAGRSPASNGPACPRQVLHTPFLVPSRCGHPSFAGVLTHWWAGRTPSEADTIVADLMARHVIALVDRERLMAAVARSDERAAQMALQAICGRTINMAVGIVMHQRGFSAEDAEDVLQRARRATGGSLYEVAAQVVRSGALADPAAGPRMPSTRNLLRPDPPSWS